MRHARNIERLEDRVDADPVAVLHKVGEVHRRAIHQHQIHLSVGDAGPRRPPRIE